LTFPGLVTIPIGFLGCWLGTTLAGRDERSERGYDELLVRTELGVGAEAGPSTATGRFRRDRERAEVL
jgi:cation/acetate symporter